MHSRIRTFDSTRRDGLLSPFVVAALMLLLFACAAAFAQSPAAGPSRLAGQTPRFVLDGTAVRVEHYEPTKMLRLAITLTPPHPLEQAQFLEDLQDKTSLQFHQFLTAAEWNARFAPSEQDEQAVADWAKSQGLTVTCRYGHRLAVDVEAPAGTIEKAFAVTIDKYRVVLPGGTLSELKFSADRDPALPVSLSAIVSSVQGLNSFERVEPASGPEPNVIEPDYVAGPAAASTGSIQADARESRVADDAEPELTGAKVTPPDTSYYDPSDMWSAQAYDYKALMNQGHCCNPLGNPGHSPAQTSIAVSTFGPLSLSDVANFQAGFPYLAYNVQIVSVDGGLSCTPSAGTCSGESSLDTEWSLSMANSAGSSANTAKVYVYVAPNGDTTDVWNHVLDDSLTRVMTQSWGCSEIAKTSGNGCTEPTMQAQDNVLQALVGQGWTVLSSSGDQGATGACSDALLVIYPASDPNVVAVGGTELGLYSNNKQFYGEPAWTGNTGAGSCSGNHGGSTGGNSVYWPVPSYQQGMGFPKRSVPDVALSADFGQNVYVNGGWAHLAGTSIATPMFAGFMAQENAYLLSLGNICGSNNASACSPMGNVDYAIYREGNKRNAAHFPFYDVTTGCNSNDITAEYHLTPFCAHAGFDQVTGWGSANMLQLAWAINWETAPANGAPNTVYSGPATNKWYNSNQNVSWTINDYPGSAGNRPTGIAGFTQGWDSIAADPTSVTNQAAASSSFFTGPQYINAKTGCLALASGEGCSGGVSQGCHTAHVRGWNNMGETTGDSTYGPVCYDTVAPTLSDTVAFGPNGLNGWYTKAPLVALYAVDTGGSAASGLAKGYYGINAPSCTTKSLGTCTVWTNQQLVSIVTQGKNTMDYFAFDNAGNVTGVAKLSFNFDYSPPATTLGLSGAFSGGKYKGTVTALLNAADNASGVATTYYILDKGTKTTYTGAFNITAVGTHTVQFWSVDVAGNVEKTNTDTFTNN